jgi:hypothetical protein
MNDYPRPVGRDGDRPPSDDELRRLLTDAVSDVEPHGGLDSIHARTKVTTMNHRRSWLLAAGAAVVATAATVAAVTLLGGDTSPGDGPGFAAPSSPSPSDAETTADPAVSESPQQPPEGDTRAVPVYYVGDTTRGVRLYREFHQIEATDDDVVSVAVDEAVSAEPDDPDYRSPWPEGTTAAATSLSSTRDVLTIDVSGATGLRTRPGGMSQEEAQIAVEQLVYTAQAADQSRKPVQFLLDSERTDQLLGVPVSEPVSQGDPVEVLAQVWIIDPAEGAEVTSPFTVSGLAAAYEATVVWELRDRAGDRVEGDFTTAEECCTMAPYSFEVDVPPGEYTLVVQDTDASGGEGFGPWVDTKSVTVTR